MERWRRTDRWRDGREEREGETGIGRLRRSKEDKREE